jgi:hypothetical protein
VHVVLVVVPLLFERMQARLLFIHLAAQGIELHADLVALGPCRLERARKLDGAGSGGLDLAPQLSRSRAARSISCVRRVCNSVSSRSSSTRRSF